MNRIAGSSGSRAGAAAGALAVLWACATVNNSQSGDGAPRAERWDSAPPMLHARSAHAVVSTRDAIYVFGGTGEGGRPVMQVERFDGTSWRDVSTLPGEGLNAPVAAAVGDRIYVIGGFRTVTNVPTDQVLIYDTRSNTWGRGAPLPEPRGGAAAAALHGKIHVIGGGNSRTTLANHSEYDPASDKWVERAPLSLSKGSPAAVAFRGTLYSIGGRSGPGDFGDVEIYDPARDSWSIGPSIEPRGTAGAAVYCGTIYIFGGESQALRSTLDEVLRLNAAHTAWDRSTSMPHARNYGRAVVLNGSVYLIGGNPAVANAHAAPGSTLVERFSATCR